MIYTANTTRIFMKSLTGDIKKLPTPKTEFTIDDELPLLMEVPEMGVAAEKIDITTLNDKVKQYITGMKDMGELVLKFLYDKTKNYDKLKDWEAKDGQNAKYAEFVIRYPDGTSHSFIATATVKMDSATINGALTFSATLTPSTDIEIGEDILSEQTISQA